MSLIAGGLAGAFGLATQLFARAQALDSNLPDVAHRRQLRRFLLQAMPQKRSTPVTHRFSGTAKELDFVTLAAAPFAPKSAIMHIRVWAEDGNLTMDITALNDEGHPVETWTAPLARDVGSISFSYVAKTEAGTLRLSEWDSPYFLPSLVEIEGPENGWMKWPYFSVSPRLF